MEGVESDLVVVERVEREEERVSIEGSIGFVDEEEEEGVVGSEDEREGEDGGESGESRGWGDIGCGDGSRVESGRKSRKSGEEREKEKKIGDEDDVCL